MAVLAVSACAPASPPAPDVAQDRAEITTVIADYEQAVADAAKNRAELEATWTALDAEVHARRTWTFTDEAARFLNNTLTTLLERMASLEANEKAAVEQRLVWARQIGALTRAHPNAHVTWAAARAAIAASER